MEKEILKELIITLRLLGQSACFGDIKSFVTSDFKEAMSRLLEKLEKSN